MNLKIDYLNIDELTPYEGNAKLHPLEQIEQIKKSITEFGMNDPIAVWGQNNIVVEGHGRLIACKELKMDKVPVIRLDDLTDEQRRAYTLIHNKLTMNTGFDINALQKELHEISYVDMTPFGFVYSTEISVADEEDITNTNNELPLIMCPRCGAVIEEIDGED